MIRGNKGLAVAANKRSVERTVQDVGTEGFLRLNQRLCEVTRIGLTNTNVIAIFHEDLGQGESQTVDLVDVALDEEHTTGLVSDRHAVWQFRRSAEAVQNGLFVVVARDALEGLEDLSILVRPLVVDPVELFVQDRFDNGAEIS